MMKTRTLITTLLLAFATMIQAQKTYLVSCGISVYPNPKMNTRICHNDAKTIQWVYDRHGNAETVLLINEQVNEAQVLQQMEYLYANAQPEDMIVFFYSGHGSPGSLVFYDKEVSYDKLCRIMANSKAKRKVVFLNCCYSGKMSDAATKGGTNTGKTISASDYRNTSVLMFLSSRPSETSLYNPTDVNCIYTNHLQRALKGGADYNRDRKITAKELYKYVHKHVLRDTNNKQHPVMWGKFDNQMVVMKW